MGVFHLLRNCFLIALLAVFLLPAVQAELELDDADETARQFISNRVRFTSQHNLLADQVITLDSWQENDEYHFLTYLVSAEVDGTEKKRLIELQVDKKLGYVTNLEILDARQTKWLSFVPKVSL